nr:hypothetical protein [Bacteroidota bacterium]
MNQGEHPQELLLNKSQISIQDLEPILSALSYFDIFKHPLTLNELFLNVHYITLDFDRFKKLVDYGIEEKIINKKDNYYFIGIESNIARRQQGEELVVNLTRRARFCVKLISLFPFTRSVMISVLSQKVLWTKMPTSIFLLLLNQSDYGFVEQC